MTTDEFTPIELCRHEHLDVWHADKGLRIWCPYTGRWYNYGQPHFRITNGFIWE